MRASFLGGLAVLLLAAGGACGGSVSGDDGNGDQDTGTGGGDSGIGGGDTSGNPDTTPGDDTTPPDPDTGFDDGIDHGAPSTTYPAFKPLVPILQNNGGPVLTNPVIVTVTYSDDPQVALFESFGDSIGTSAYWKAVTAEYGVGPSVSGPSNHVHVPGTPPATMSGRDFRNLVQANAGVAGSGWPAPTDQTIYVLYASPSTKVTSFGGGDICASGVGGYHQSTTAAGVEVSYAVLPACKGFGNRTSTASHELAEAATDPFGSSPAFRSFDYLGWELWLQFNDENGDACEFFVDSFYTETESGFAYDVQRQWSNDAVKGFHNPCVPAKSGAYFNTVPLDMEDITVDLSSIGGGLEKTKGYHVAVGETKTFPIGLWSDSAADPWSLRVVEGNPTLGPVTTSHLTVSMDIKSGQNGQKAYVTVTVKSLGDYGSELISVESFRFGGSQAYMPILIGSR